MSSSHIFDTKKDTFPDDIAFGKATRIVGETATQFLLKSSYKSLPFLIQTPKLHLKQKFQKASSPGSIKGMTAELVFSVHESEFFDWINKLEEHCIAYLFQNQKQWFQTDLSTEDIEGLFVSPFRLFKSSKIYQMRCHISDLGQSLKIFGTDKSPIDYDEQYHTDNPLLGIIEIVGIRCSQKHFQIDMELKQLLELPTEKDLIKETCLIHDTISVSRRRFERTGIIRIERTGINRIERTGINRIERAGKKRCRCRCRTKTTG
jgi:hypothetical protein